MMQTNMMRPAAAAAFAVLFLAVLQNAIHLKKLNRGRQILLPLVAFIYAVCGTVGLCLGFHRVLLYLGLASRFAGFETVLMNLLLAVGFLGVKIPLRFVLSGIWKNDRLMEITGARFYEYDEARGNWFLKKEWAGIRLIMTAFFWCSTLLSALFMALSVLAGNGTVLGNLYFPVQSRWCFVRSQVFLAGRRGRNLRTLYPERIQIFAGSAIITSSGKFTKSSFQSRCYPPTPAVNMRPDREPRIC